MAMSKQKFFLEAKDVMVQIDGQTIVAKAKKDASAKGNVGYYGFGKVSILMPDGSRCNCQVGLNITAIKSAEWADEGFLAASTIVDNPHRSGKDAA